MSETSLHKGIVKFIRSHFPNFLIDAGLGELQDTSRKRTDAWEKGYTKGKPDLLIFNHRGPWKGLAIEFKSPRGSGVLSEEQKIYLEKLKRMGWKTAVIKDYNNGRNEIISYVRER